MAIAVVLSSASTTIHWFLLFSYFLSLFMSQSCLADDQYFKLHRGRLISRKLCPSCKLYPFFRDSPIVAARESIAWIPVRASVSAAAVMVLLCSIWHMSRRNHRYEEELQENGQDQTGILGSRESTTGNDNTDDTFEDGNQQVECPDLSLFPLHLIRKVTKYFSMKIGNQVETQDLPLFPLDVIYEATQNFSVENKIGQGGFGSVYKGILGGGKEIAVKRLSTTSGQGMKEFEKAVNFLFEKEVNFLSKLQHENVVRLMGCCTERNELILIYEYLPNKSLDYALSDSRARRVLDWKTRISIINGIAQGLHEVWQHRIIHRDLKPSNVLLDDAMNPKISDFGSAIIFYDGYMAPEYMMEGRYSIKTDVYSFGVLLLEIISGIQSHYFSEYGNYIWGLWREGRLDELTDPAVVQSCDRIELRRCIHIGLLCVQENPTDRPTMSSIVVMLTSDEINLPQPNVPAFYEIDCVVERIEFTHKSK